MNKSFLCAGLLLAALAGSAAGASAMELGVPQSQADISQSQADVSQSQADISQSQADVSQPQTAAPQTQNDSTVYSIYEALLRQNINEYGNAYFGCYDIDGDGVRELIVQTPDYLYDVYDVVNGAAVRMGQCGYPWFTISPDGTRIGSANADILQIYNLSNGTLQLAEEYIYPAAASEDSAEYQTWMSGLDSADDFLPIPVEFYETEGEALEALREMFGMSAASSSASITGFAGFDRIIQAYLEGLRNQWGFQEFTDSGLCYLAAYNPSLTETGYYLADLDQNGITELLIGESPADGYAGMFYELYTLSGDEPVLVASSAERARYYLCSDGTIAFEGSGGASSSYYSYFALNGTQLILKEAVIYDDMQNAANPWFYSTSASYDDFSTPISEAEARAVIAKYSYVNVPYSSFAGVDGGDSGTQQPESDPGTAGSGQADTAAGEYLLPDSSTRAIVWDDIDEMSPGEIQQAINEIYARHGKVFSMPENDAYFRAKSWYSPIPGKTDEQIWDEMNEYEQANVDFMARFI